MLPQICNKIYVDSNLVEDSSKLLHKKDFNLPKIIDSSNSTGSHTADHNNNEESSENEHETEEEFDFNQDGINDMPPIYKLYLKKCKQNNIYPIKHVQDFLQYNKSRSLNLEEISLADVRKFGVLFGILKGYRNISQLSLKSTNIPIASLTLLSKLICKNQHITDLNLSHNFLHGNGATIINKGLDISLISRLNLKSTGLDDSDLVIFKETFANSTTLLKLILSQNNFGENGGHTFSYILQNNSMLEKLDISWNCIRRSGACALANGLRHNRSLLYLKVAFNGFGDEGAVELGKAVAENIVLAGLDIKHNRITNEGLIGLSRGLFYNDNLKKFDISGNLVTSQGAQYILRSMMKTKALQELHMGHLSPDKLCMNAIKYLQRTCPNMVITYGAPCSNTMNSLHEKYIIHKDIFNAIRKYLTTERLRMLDLFMSWDKSKRGYLTYDELVNGLVSCRINITKNMLEDMFEKLDEDKNGTIEYKEFVAISKLE